MGRHVVLVHIRDPRPFHHVRSLLGHHYDGSDGIAVWSRGEHGRVHHPQIGHAEHAKLRIDHRLRIIRRSHFARACVMVLGPGISDHHAGPVRVRPVCMGHALRIRGRFQTHIPFSHRPCVHQRQYDPYALHHGQHVPPVLEVIRLDHRVIQRVPSPQRNIPLASGQQIRGPGPNVRSLAIIFPVRRARRI